MSDNQERVASGTPGDMTYDQGAVAATSDPL